MVQYTEDEIRAVFEQLNLTTEEDRLSKKFDFFMLSETKENEDLDNVTTITDNTARLRK